MRMQDLLCDGWIKKSGTTSARAGMNGGARAESLLEDPSRSCGFPLAAGMDDLCGRLVYYDEYATHPSIRAALALTLDPLSG